MFSEYLKEPPFSTKAPRFDMDTFVGRSLYFYRMMDPRYMLVPEANIRSSFDLLTRVKKTGNKEGHSDHDLWEQRLMVESCVHPKTEKTIPAFCRFAAFLPVNLFIVPVMLMKSTINSPYRTAAIHIINQSYNCAVNYANRSSDEVEWNTLGLGYATAVVVSVSGSLGATFLLRSMKNSSGSMVSIVRATVPFAAVAFAGGANVGMMRREEWSTKGVDVVDEDGESRGKSVAAGKLGIQKCAVARFLWNLPVMFLPPIMLMPLAKTKFFATHPTRMMLAETAACGIGMALGVAPALAAFKPIDKVSVKDLEPQFHNLKDKSGKPIEFLSYYKGL